MAILSKFSLEFELFFTYNHRRRHFEASIKPVALGMYPICSYGKDGTVINYIFCSFSELMGKYKNRKDNIIQQYQR